MVQEEILQNNALIAKFMGWVRTVDEGGIQLYELGAIPGKYDPSLPIQSIGNFNYNTSWDWLMPVIEKIYSLNEYFIYKNETSRQFFDGGIELTPNIELVYPYVINFINWYNQQ